MPKSNKQNNDLRGLRKGTAAGIVAAGVLCLAALSVGVARFGLGALRWGAVCLAAFLLSVFLLWLLLERHGRLSGDEKLAPVMGRIMFDAVVKMPTPVFICDSDERILWYNNATEALHSSRNKLYGESVKELFGVTLEEIRQGEATRLFCEGRIFQASYSHIRTEEADFALILTSEITETEALRSEMADREPAVCYILIDNLAEMMQYDSELYRPAAARVDEVLRTWADHYNGILKEYERDRYLFLTEARVVDALVASKFDILDRVRAVKVGESSLPLTVSMGVCAVPGDFEDKERAAHAALELALQRGGDQAVVKRGEGTEFYGGITRSVQKRTNVQARVISNELIALMRSASNVVVMGHRRADFDAYGSAVGIARLAMYCGARVNIAVDLANRDILGQRRMLDGEEDFIGVTVSPEEALDRLEIGTLVVMTDVSNMANVESLELARRAEKLAVIDHHRKTAEFEREPDVEYIDPSSSSACELIAEMLEQALPRDELSAAEAGVMLAGITLDTMQFSKNTGTRTFSAAMYLRERGADPALVRNLFKESFEEYSGEAQFRRNAEIYRGCCAIAVAEAGEGASPVVAAKAANNLIMVDGMRAAFTLMELGDSVKISARSAGDLNVQLIMEELGGGGSFTGAAAVRQGTTIPALIDELKAAIDKYL